MPLRCFASRCLTILLPILAAASAPAQWPQFRGPTGQGHAEEANIPLSWSESENITWKTALPGQGWSSPVIEGGEVWMTAAVVEPLSEDEQKRRLAEVENSSTLELAGTVSLRAIGVDLESGKLLHDLELLRVEHPQPIHQLNSYASPTPVISGGRLFCHFGTYGTVCVRTSTGEILWTNSELQIDHQNGPGSSPISWQNLLIVHCDGIDRQFIAALNQENGEVVWKTDRSGPMNERPPLKKAYCTPLVIEVAGREELISPAADWVYGYEPASGKELWRAGYGSLGFSTVPRPVAGHGLVYLCTSFNQSQLIAVRPGGSGDVSETHVAWKDDKQIAKMPSPLLVGGELYVVSDSGILTCFDATSGETIFRERLGGNYSASPLLAAGRIYFFSREGETTVIRPGRAYQELGKSRLDGSLMASPAVAGNALVLRTDTHLYRVEVVD